MNHRRKIRECADESMAVTRYLAAPHLRADSRPCKMAGSSSAIRHEIWPMMQQIQNERMLPHASRLEHDECYRGPAYVSASVVKYFCETSSAWIFRAVSVATPTKIRTLVPANPRKAVKWVVFSATSGATARIPRNTDPRMDIRVRIWTSTGTKKVSRPTGTHCLLAGDCTLAEEADGQITEPRPLRKPQGKMSPRLCLPTCWLRHF
jgi:hypothetical protein